MERNRSGLTKTKGGIRESLGLWGQGAPADKPAVSVCGDRGELMTKQVTPQDDKVRVVALDGIRGLAIASVLVSHLWPELVFAGSLGRFLSSWKDLGAFGVDLFFVLSGFLITGILLDSRSSPNYFSNFYTRRVFRIFPLYYSYLLILAVLLPGIHSLLRTSMADYQGNWWWYIAYVCNFKSNHAADDSYLGHFWSLAIEEQFYIVWPTVVLLATRRRLVYISVGLILLSFALRCLWSVQGVHWNTIYRLTATRFDPLAMGALIAISLRSRHWCEAAKTVGPYLAVVGLGSFAVVAIMSGGPQWDRPAVQTVGSLLAGVGFAGLVLFAATQTNGWFHRFLCNRVLVACGKYSYCIYIVHVVIGAHITWVISYLVRLHPQLTVPLGLAGFVVATLLSFFVGYFSWKYFESPILRWHRATTSH